MKKINLIACAALVAGLLISCSSEAGVKDYNSVTSTSTEYEYLVSGTVTTVSNTSSTSYDKDGKQNGGDTRSTTRTEEIVSAEAFATFSTDANYNSNVETIEISVAASNGYLKVDADGSDWNGTKLESWSSSQKEAASTAKASKPEQPVGSQLISLYKVDGEWKVKADNKLWAVEIDEDKLTAGEDFEISYEVTTDDSTTKRAYTSYDADGKENKDFNSSSAKTSKSTKTLKLSFKAQGKKAE